MILELLMPINILFLIYVIYLINNIPRDQKGYVVWSKSFTISILVMNIVFTILHASFWGIKQFS